jgi:SEC-C motif-containing protein
LSAVEACPCGRADPRGRALAYTQCCGRFHAGEPAPDAESLMRSRYSAFVRGDEAYLRDTWHESTRPAQVHVGDGTRWLGLEVKDHRAIDATHAEVEFVARFRDKSGRGARLHERSRFVREGGRWFYVDGDQH